MVVMAKSGHMGIGTFCVTSADALVHLMRHAMSHDALHVTCHVVGHGACLDSMRHMVGHLAHASAALLLPCCRHAWAPLPWRRFLSCSGQ